MNIRRATIFDIPGVEKIYNEIHDAEESNKITTGWIRNVYPTRTFAEEALQRGELFIMEEDNIVYGAARINHDQVDVYEGAPWKHDTDPSGICVLHTLVISPRAGGRGLGKQFVRFYEDYAWIHGWPELRLDTNARNKRAREMYRKLGYDEIGVFPTTFNGIPEVNLVLLEKWLGE